MEGTGKRNGSLKVGATAVGVLAAAVMMFLGIAGFVRAEIAEHAAELGHRQAVTREAFEEFRLGVYRRLDRIEGLLMGSRERENGSE
jgi:hypothetical protein